MVTTALVAVAGWQAQAAQAGQVVARVDGDVRALALTADGLVLARQPDREQVVVERRGPGGSVTTLGRIGSTSAQDVALAAAGTTVVVAVRPAETDGVGPDREPSSTYVASPTGLARVAGCADAIEAPAVATDGVRTAFMVGGCREVGEQDDDDVVTPATLAIEPGAGRIPLGDGVLTGLALTPGGVGASTRLPSLIGSRSSVLRVGAPGDATFRSGRPTARVVGAVADGRLVVQRTTEQSGFDSTCSQDLAVLGERTPRILDFGACVQGPSGFSADEDIPTGVVAGTRAAAVVQGEDYGTELATLPVDGLGVRVLDRSRSRPPQALAAVEGRVAWARVGCDARTEVVVAVDAPGTPATTTPDCGLAVARNPARVTGRVAILSVRCARGCSGTAREGSNEVGSPFRVAPGRGEVRVPIGRRALRRGVARIDIDVLGGRERVVTVRLRTTRG